MGSKARVKCKHCKKAATWLFGAVSVCNDHVIRARKEWLGF